MKHALKKFILAALVLVAAAGFSGCAEMLYGDGLLALPALPSEYVDLQEHINRVLSTGASPAAADSGENRQSIQLVDLDGDGGNETVAFFRQEDGSFLIKAYRKDGDNYVEIGTAEAVGLSLHSIYYPVVSATGQRCLAICWGIDDSSNYGMDVFYFTSAGMESVLNIRYSALMVGDFYGDGIDELCFILKDRSGRGMSLNTYSVAGGGYVLDWAMPLCDEALSVMAMEIGQCSDGRRAVFIDSVTDENEYVTDVIMCQRGSEPVNLTADDGNSGGATLRAGRVYCADIDGDGFIEVPSGYSPVGLKYPDERNKVKWTAYGARQETRCVTYHASGDGWYLKWPENWDDAVSVVTTRYSKMIRTVFYRPMGDGDEETAAVPDETNTLLTVYIFSGDNRQNSPSLYKAVELGRRDGQLYAYGLGSALSARYNLSDEQAAESVMLIETDWIGGGY